MTVGPIPGLQLTREMIPGNTQSVTGLEIRKSQAVSLNEFLNSNLQSVNVNDYQGNPFQMDVTFRGFSASPQLGTPQGLSVFLDGTRVNEPFGDVVNWDLIPLNAISGLDLYSGSNPLFGLNTLGGALSLRTRSGFTDQGVEAQVTGGQWGRKQAQAAAGGSKGTLAGFVAGTWFDEDGWRDDSRSTVRQGFGRVDLAASFGVLTGTMLLADNNLIGNGLIPLEMFRDRSQSVFSSPGGEQRLLCPAYQALADPGDPATTVYGFVNLAGDSLLVTTTAGAATGVHFIPAGGTPSTCRGSCGVTIGAFGPDSTVPLTFSQSTAGGATINGTVTSAPGGVMLPPLYCVENKFVLIRPDRTVMAGCGTPSVEQIGAWTRFRISDETGLIQARFTADDQQLKLLTVYHFDQSFQRVNDFACELSGCSGVEIGPAVEDANGALYRRITFSRTRLGAVASNGTIDPGSLGTLNLTMRVAVFTGNQFPDPASCDGLDSVRVSYSDETPGFSLCPPPENPDIGFSYKGTNIFEGQPIYFVTDAQLNRVIVFMNGSAVTQIIFTSANSNGIEGECLDSDCSGVTVSAPDGQGNRSLTFSNTTVLENEGGIRLSSVRRSVINGTISGIPPATPPE